MIFKIILNVYYATNVYLKIISLDGDKVSDYEMKLMDLDTEHLGIPVSN